MKLGDALIYIFTIIALIGLGTMFGMGLFYLEHTVAYGIIGFVTIISGLLSYVLVTIKNEN